MERIIFFLLAILTFSGCVSKIEEPTKENVEYPLFLGYSESDGYKYEIWKKEDGSKYLKRGNKKIDLPK